MRSAMLGAVLCTTLGGVCHAELYPLSQPAELAGWKTELGDWRVADGALLQAAEGLPRTITWQPAVAYSDLDVSVEFLIHPVGEGVRAPGLVYRAVDQRTYYYIHFDLKNSQVVWVRAEPQREWADARRHKCADMKAGQWQTARVVCRGDEHQVYLDGKLLFTEKDDKLKSGVVALRTGQCRTSFRNLKVEGTRVEPATPFEVKIPPFFTVCADAGAGTYEAFPDICRTRAGELLCVFYAGYGHVSVPNEKLPRGARIALCRSTDDGKTWSPAATVVDSPIDDRDASITELPGGDLLVVYMSYDPKRTPGTHQVFTVRSTDGGKTWGEPVRVPTPFTSNEAVSEPIRVMPDGRLLLPVYGSMADQAGPRYVSGVLESRDSGESWSTLAVVRSSKYELCEPSVVRLPDGKLLMLIRPTMTACTSEDGGRTWTEPAPLGIPGDAPYLLLTSKQVLLCGIRHRPTSSTSMLASTDYGKTWSGPVALDPVIGAYPSMVELPDGRILVVYYTEGAGSDIRSMYLRADAEGVHILEREPERAGATPTP